MARRAHLFTIGYEQHREVSSLVAALDTAGIERVVDVRALPLSRRRGFSKRGLASALEDVGIEYVHDRRLGNPKPLRDLYKQGQVSRGARAYRKHLAANAAEAVRSLVASLRGARTCLLCLEHDPRVCHRSIIVEAVTAELPSLRVVDL